VSKVGSWQFLADPQVRILRTLRGQEDYSRMGAPRRAAKLGGRDFVLQPFQVNLQTWGRDCSTGADTDDGLVVIG